MVKKIDKIMKDLETLDASVDDHRENMKKTIEEIIKSKPDTRFRSSFKKRLEKELLLRAEEISGEKERKSRGMTFTLNKYRVAGGIAAAVITAIILVPLYLTRKDERASQVATNYKLEEMPSERLGKAEKIIEKKARTSKAVDGIRGQRLPGFKDRRNAKEIAGRKSALPPAADITASMKKKSLSGDMSGSIGTGSADETDDLKDLRMAPAESEAISSREEKKKSEPVSLSSRAGKRGRNYENQFLDAGKNPLSAFSVVADTASYRNTRRFLTGNRLPPRDTIRIEEFINSFSYDYPVPRSKDHFSVTTEIGRCPWNGKNKLVHIGIKGSCPLAKNMKIQVKFNPSLVRSYRLIGYENGMPGKEDFNHDTGYTGKPGPGDTVTALYEIIPARYSTVPGKTGSLKYRKTRTGKVPVTREEIITVNIRYRKTGEKINRLMIKSVRDRKVKKLSNNFRFSAAAAEFGMLLRKSRFKGNASYAQVRELAEKSLGKDRFGYRREFLRLVKRAEMLDRGE